MASIYAHFTEAGISNILFRKWREVNRGDHPLTFLDLQFINLVATSHLNVAGFTYKIDVK